MSDRNVVIIAYGPGETATSAAERHFARRPEDRGSPRILCINTGVARSGRIGSGRELMGIEEAEAV
jgi:hypothetical protein